MGPRRVAPALPLTMVRHRIGAFVFALAAGVAVGSVAPTTIGFTAAIAAPLGYFTWFKAYGMLPLGSFLWDLVVVGGLGLGLLAFLAGLLVFRSGTAGQRWANGAGFVAATLLAGELLHPLLEGYPSNDLRPWSRTWSSYGVELALLAATLAAMALAQRGDPARARAR